MWSFAVRMQERKLSLSTHTHAKAYRCCPNPRKTEEGHEHEEEY